MANAKTSLNKSELIREYLSAHKRKKPVEISALIVAEKGLEITPSYISNIKQLMKGKRKAKRLAKTAARSTAAAPDDRSALFAAANLIVIAGGIEQAKDALGAVAKVASMVR